MTTRPDLATTSLHRDAGNESRGRRALPLLLLGGLGGLAWSCGLRGFMAMIAGAGSEVTWTGTFVWILLPGTLTGILLGWAEHLRRTGGTRGRRWLALAPLLFLSVLVPSLFTDPGSFLSNGIGGGAIGVPLIGMACGYALARRGPVWARSICALLALSAIPVWVAAATSIGGPSFSVTEPRGAWMARFYWSFLAILSLASAIPHQSVEADRPPSARAST
jgi:hypothetical protein